MANNVKNDSAETHGLHLYYDDGLGARVDYTDFGLLAFQSDINRQYIQSGSVSEWTYLNENFMFADITLPVQYKNIDYNIIATKGINEYCDTHINVAVGHDSNNQFRIYLEGADTFTALWDRINKFTVFWLTVGEI